LTGCTQPMKRLSIFQFGLCSDCCRWRELHDFMLLDPNRQPWDTQPRMFDVQFGCTAEFWEMPLLSFVSNDGSP
jgi:hypothetical protein